MKQFNLLDDVAGTLPPKTLQPLSVLCSQFLESSSESPGSLLDPLVQPKGTIQSVQCNKIVIQSQTIVTGQSTGWSARSYGLHSTDSCESCLSSHRLHTTLHFSQVCCAVGAYPLVHCSTGKWANCNGCHVHSLTAVHHSQGDTEMTYKQDHSITG